MEKSCLNLCVVCLCILYWPWRNRKKNKELSENLKTKIVEKHGQSQGCMSISWDLDVPVSTVRNVIKEFTAHGTVANIPGCGWKRETLMKECNEGLFEWWIKNLDQLPNKFKLTCSHTVATVSACTIRGHLNEMGRYGRRPKRTQNLPEEVNILLGQCHVDRRDQTRAFCQSTLLYSLQKMPKRPSKKGDMVPVVKHDEGS